MPCIYIGYEQEVPNAKRDTRFLPGGVIVIISQKTPFGRMGWVISLEALMGLYGPSPIPISFAPEV